MRVSPNQRITVVFIKPWGKFTPGQKLTGIILPSRTSPQQCAWRAWSGAVLASLRLDTGKTCSIPWSRNYIQVMVGGKE